MFREKIGGVRFLVPKMRGVPLKHYLLIGFILFITPLTVSYGDSEASLTVLNETDYFLHVYINGEPHLYLAPNHSSTASFATVTFTVTAFYAPGQGVSGDIKRTFEAPYTPGSSTSGCSENDSSVGCECDKTTTPAEYGRVVWEITADTMLVDE
jgi:hypothetical protein